MRTVAILVMATKKELKMYLVTPNEQRVQASIQGEMKLLSEGHWKKETMAILAIATKTERLKERPEEDNDSALGLLATAAI